MKKLHDLPLRAAAAKLFRAKSPQVAAPNGLPHPRLQGGAGAVSIKDFTARYAISCDTLTRMTGFSLRAVSNWSQGAKPSSSTARRLTEIQRLLAALEKLVSPEAIGPWLKDPNPAFDGSTPLQVIERGENDRIWRMVYELQSGEPA
jgi:hypothetical protein